MEAKTDIQISPLLGWETVIQKSHGHYWTVPGTNLGTEDAAVLLGKAL